MTTHFISNTMMLELILSLLFASTLAHTISKPIYLLEDAEQHFEDFIRNHGKQYANEDEKKMRFENFKQFLLDVNDRNSDPDETATFGITKFADLTLTEFLQKHTGFKPGPVYGVNHVYGPVTTDLPENFDWRNQNAVTRVKNQRDCNTCWAFSTTGAVEGAYAIKHKNLKEFSEQQLQDCMKGQNCMQGGDYSDALEFLRSVGGSETENDYPYEFHDDTCKFNINKVVAKVTGLIKHNILDEEKLKQVLYENGPLSIAVDASSLIGAHHGIIQNCTFQRVNHAVLLVGYGTENGIPFWTIKNSWGTDAGEDGYHRVRRGVNACGLTQYPATQALVA